MPHSRVSLRAAMEDLNDDALGLILLKVDSHVSLIRAAAVCRRWRRAIADTGFLRRYRSLHAPTVPGHYHNRPWRLKAGPVFVPSSESMVDARHFSVDFLPASGGPWSVVDSRGSLLLLWGSRCLGFTEMVVCEPLTRRFEIIPLPAVEILEGSTYLNSYLIDGIATEAGGHISMSNFRVLCCFDCDDIMHTAMVTAGSPWGEKNICHALPNVPSTIIMGPVGGKWYFYINSSTLAELDRSTGDFTSSVFPAIVLLYCDIQQWNCFVTELRDGKPRIITVFNSTVKVFARLDSGEWALEKSALLWEATSGIPGYERSFFDHRQEILMRGTGFIILSPEFKKSWTYSIDLETMVAKQATVDVGYMAYPSELPWPPALDDHLN